MDILISDGDVRLSDCGEVTNITSIDEACQRARLIFSTKKGSFAYNRSLGADFSSVDSSDVPSKTAKLICEEALASQKEISVGDVRLSQSSNGALLNVEIIYNGENKTVEVDISENI